MDDSTRNNSSPAQEDESRDYSDDGVDLTLIRWMLSLSPSERLRVLQDFINSIQKLRRGQAGG